MKNVLGGLAMAGFIVGLHIVAGLIITYAAWLGILVLAFGLSAVAFMLLSDLGVVEIDLSKLREEASRARH